MNSRLEWVMAGSRDSVGGRRDSSVLLRRSLRGDCDSRQTIRIAEADEWSGHAREFKTFVSPLER